MNKILQYLLLFGSLIMMIIVITNIKKSKMKSTYSIMWIIWCLILIIISLFPNLVYYISGLFGFEKPVNAIFLLAIFSLYCLVFYLYKTISKQNNEIINLNYELAKIKKESKEENNSKRNK